MRLIKGSTLKQAIEEFHRACPNNRDPGERSSGAAGLVAAVDRGLNAVAYAHSRGVVHRDLKPSNVMLGLYGETLVVDWGLAKCVDRHGPTGGESEYPFESVLAAQTEVTKTGFISGTPTFMSPEQAEAKPSHIGPATDVYSLGATLYAILAGKVPFEGENPHVLLRKLKEGKPTTPGAISSSVLRPLEAVCLKAMRRRPEDRYDSPRLGRRSRVLARRRAGLGLVRSPRCTSPPVDAAAPRLGAGFGHNAGYGINRLGCLVGGSRRQKHRARSGAAQGRGQR